MKERIRNLLVDVFEEDINRHDAYDKADELAEEILEIVKEEVTAKIFS